MIRNPNAPAEREPALPPGRETAILARLAALVANWPARDEIGTAIQRITARELLVRLRADLPAGVPAEAITPGRLRGWLRGVGYRAA